jgi:hypothetical protein
VDHLNLHLQRLKGTWFATILLSKVMSKLGNTCANVYTQGKFTRIIPMMSRKDTGKSLVELLMKLENLNSSLRMEQHSLLESIQSLLKKQDECALCYVPQSRDVRTKIMQPNVRLAFLVK